MTESRGLLSGESAVDDETGLAIRPSGCRSATRCAAPAGSGKRRRLSSTIGVRTEPGQTSLTQTPTGANSTARNLVRAITAPFDAE